MAAACAQLIETLSKELDNKKQLEEDLYQAQNTIKVKDRELKDQVEELKTLKRIHAKKDKLIVTMENEKDDLPIKALEGDKRFLQVWNSYLLWCAQQAGRVGGCRDEFFLSAGISVENFVALLFGKRL